MRGLALWSGTLATLGVLGVSPAAWAQYPQPQPQPYPAPAPAPQGYPPPQQPQAYPTYPPAQPYPQQPQAYPPQPGAAPYGQPYPPYGQPQPGYGAPAPGYGPPPAGSGQPYGAPWYPPPQRSQYRSPGEMAYLYGVGAAYGFGTGVWLDSLVHEKDPGLWVITPLVLTAAAPIGTYAWDYYSEFHRGVPSSIATGLLLGGVEGVAIGGLQWQATGRGGPNTWGFATDTSVTFVAATAGGVGGYFFGEYYRPNPRTLAFVTSGAGFGTAFGVLFGSGVASSDWKNGAAPWGFFGYNAGIAAAAVASAWYTPSWSALKAMWIGDLLGTLATTPVYLFYLGSSADPRHGLIANAIGGVAGLGIATVLTLHWKEPATADGWTPPFQVALSPMQNGAALTAMGQW
ncbi:MAG TPA: hypothetical protein VIF09_14965 [Polyangiaceae bacterium]